MEKVSNIASIYPIDKPIQASVKVPGSKSYTNRALVVAALANGVTIISGASDANDTRILIKLLDRLGVEIIERGGVIEVRGNGGSFEEFNGALNVEDAGTVMRFLTALCCLVPGEITIGGSDRMNQRPIKELVSGLKKLGAEITYTENDGFPPIKINGGSINGGPVHINGSVSSQFISALLMITPLLARDTEVHITGDQVSEPYIDMTVSVMKQFGVSPDKSEKYYSISANQQYQSCKFQVEGDASSASYLFAIAALSQSRIEVTNLSGKSLQSDVRFADILEKMGCKVDRSSSSITVTGGKELKAVKVNMQDMPDTAQTLAVLAAFAKGGTTISGLKTLQHKESKRITVLEKELSKMGVKCEAGSDYIKITGGNPKGAVIETYNDHRMAMAFAVAGVKVQGMVIEAPQVVKKSFPSFWETLKSIGINVDIG